MNIRLLLFSLCSTILFSGNSQSNINCDSLMVTEICGLDCAMMACANVTPDSYQWIYCDSTLSPIPGDTLYYFNSYHLVGEVAVIATFGECIDTSYCTPICHIGINENFLPNEISVYPNPFTNELSFDVKNIDFFDLYIFDIQGKTVYSQLYLPSISKINLNHLEKGTYILKIESQLKVFSRQFIRE